jgi:ASPIC and UnbV./FG-GAP repeat.
MPSPTFGRLFLSRPSPASLRVLSLLALLPAATPLAATPPLPEFCSPAAIPGTPMPNQPESTRRMVAMLQKIASDSAPFENPYRSAETAELLRATLAATNDPAGKFKIRLPFGNALLRSGAPREALAQFQHYEAALRERSPDLPSHLFVRLQTLKALSHLRIGEQDNCLLNHNGDSCLFPIRPGGVHQLPDGSRAAIAELTPLLEKFPGDLRARWLLNIAYMTLGEYPAKVPAHLLIPPDTFESDHDIKRFPDVAPALGLDTDGLAGGVVLDDFDNDGFLDVLSSSWLATGQLRFFRNNGDATFTERTAEAGLLGLTGGLNLIHADYDNDGFLDVLVLRGAWLGSLGRYPNSLLRNNGDGTFTDVTEESGLLSFNPTQTAAWFDFNHDGHLDLFIGNETTPGEKDPFPCELYRNNGDGTFTECASASGVAFVGFVKAVVAGDFNNDGRPDLYLSLKHGPNVLFRNDGPAVDVPSSRAPWRFTNVAAEAGVTEPYESFSCWFWDYDNDGWLDLMVNGYGIQDAGDIAADYLGLPHAGHRARLFRNNRDGTFADVTKQVGLFKLLHTMGCNFGDLDNDGWLDFYVGTGDPDLATLLPNRMFRNDAARRFQDVTTSGGFGQLQKGHAIAFGDIDNDGDQDVFADMGGAVSGDTYRNQLFANPGHGNRWLKLQLEGVKSNRDARGARITLVLQTPSGQRTLHREVSSGGSFGASPLRQEIGLGDATAILHAEIFWPVTGQTQRITGLQPDHAYHIREDASSALAVNLRSFPLPLRDASPHHHAHAAPATPSHLAAR